ncbi:acetylcholine receptor subunit alpha-1-A-like precursor [Limulus polyphemus]|uniref:Acetylcholine receptor subunit alpha-1-A-like precursor n=1 Tax=Limulus polyphemus TaxID=6850 RepID=I1SKH2_LIMPO|nr:acetylcholine receptor subunit alpha-1-A-like precursor [Limulus polyphemus]ABI96923.1 soluble acetylcholine binding protein [Limulus polyphemus]
MEKFLILKLTLLSVLQLKVLCSSLDESKLLNAKLLKYDKRVIPKENKDTPISVKIGFQMRYISSLDEETNTLNVEGWLLMKWKDADLQWDPEEFGGVKELYIDSSDIWTPDIALYESSSADNFFPRAQVKLIARNTGEVLWVPPVSFQTICPLVPNSYEQRCNLTLGSWVRSIRDIDVHPDPDTDPDGESFVRVHQKWELIDVNIIRKDAIYSCCPENYPSIVHTLHFKLREARGQRSPQVAVYCNH